MCMSNNHAQAFAMALHSAHAHCGSVPGVRPAWQPELVSDFEALLPSIDSVPLPGALPTASLLACTLP